MPSRWDARGAFRLGHHLDVSFVGENLTDAAYEEVLGYLTQTTPSFSLRGGTREILRGIIARGLGLR